GIRQKEKGKRKNEESSVLFPFSFFLFPWLWWLLALLCVAGGFLTKWTTPAFFYATAVPLLWWRGRLQLLWGSKHLAAAVLAAAVCLVWLAAVVAQVGWPLFAATLEQEGLH